MVDKVQGAGRTVSIRSYIDSSLLGRRLLGADDMDCKKHASVPVHCIIQSIVCCVSDAKRCILACYWHGRILQCRY